MDRIPSDNPQRTLHRVLKLLHFIGTFWFIVCVGFILVMGLRHAGFNWWVIFSLSAHTVVIVFVLISLYLFAVFRGAKRISGYEIEHPLTSTHYYMAFYVVAPFLGTGAGLIHGILNMKTVIQFVYGISLATFGTTFLVWVILDPLAALIETYTPASRRHRHQRQARQRAIRQEKHDRRQAMLNRIFKEEEQNRLSWDQTLRPYADELSNLLLTNKAEFTGAAQRAAEIALDAWKLGGLACMHHLHEQALSRFAEVYPDYTVNDYIAYWWDGIGAWRYEN